MNGLSNRARGSAVLALAMGFLISAAGAAAADTASPVGQWRTFHPDTGAANTIVEIAETGGTLEGTIVELLAGATETNCAKCDGTRKNQPLVGMVILWDLKPESGGWGGGTILRPATGGTANASVKLTDGGQKLDVKGSRGMMSRTQTWERV
ncbi:MAG: DUF2147 domain-containing protein, partial [Parvibaculum sp.]|nr:DUF2147 domain-containing protein [Parvibaculum sp.]